MKIFSPPSHLGYVMLIGVLLLAACSPKFDWREVRGANAPYVAAFPGKTASNTRNFNLAGSPIAMTMTVAQVDGVTFAVGSAQFPDAAKAQAALTQMKIGLVNNIGGTIKQEKTSVSAKTTNGGVGDVTTIQIEAIGTQNRYGNAQPMLLIGRFVARDKHVFQVFVVGKEKSVVREAVETFLISFKLNR